MKTCPTCRNTYPDDFSLCPRDGTHVTAQATETEAQLAAGLSRRFHLVRRLGKGGMGTVFLAEQTGVGNRPVALKVLNRKLLDDPDFLMRFQNEAGSTGRIHHPNVVTIYESAQADDGTPYIAMEFLEGESLRDVLKHRGALPVTEVAEILQQAARGLSAAHKLGIIHRDLKPDNLFLTHGDEGELVVKVVDFGIAKLRESATHTQTGTVLGTPAYMSYEQASGMRSDELDARSDIYSLGVVVYEMLTGRTPFHSDTPVGYLRKHLMEEPPPFRTVKPGLPVPPRIESVVMKALAKDRNQRYGSVLEFAQEFAQAAEAGSHPAAQPEAQHETAKPQPQTTVTPVPETIVPAAVRDTRALKPAPERPHRSGRKWLVVAGSLIFLIVATAGGFWFWSRAGLRTAQRQTVRTPDEVRENAKDGLKYVWIPPGTFMMGCSPGDTECLDDEKPLHQVTITKGFWLGQTEVTVEAYKRFAATPGKAMPSGYDIDNPGWSNGRMPIVDVSWEESNAYCAWAGGRLPTEAEWEYAARGGSAGARYGPVDEVAWHDSNSGGQTHEVGLKRANLFGLYDMLGNVWEWVNDWYDPAYYKNGPSQDPWGPVIGQYRLIRGVYFPASPEQCRVSARSFLKPSDYRYPNIGFRCVGEVFAP